MYPSSHVKRSGFFNIPEERPSKRDCVVVNSSHWHLIELSLAGSCLVEVIGVPVEALIELLVHQLAYNVFIAACRWPIRVVKIGQ